MASYEVITPYSGATRFVVDEHLRRLDYSLRETGIPQPHTHGAMAGGVRDLDRGLRWRWIRPFTCRLRAVSPRSASINFRSRARGPRGVCYVACASRRPPLKSPRRSRVLRVPDIPLASAAISQSISLLAGSSRDDDAAGRRGRCPARRFVPARGAGRLRVVRAAMCSRWSMARLPHGAEKARHISRPAITRDLIVEARARATRA